MSKANAMQEDALRVLKAAVAEAGGVSHVFVYRESVMNRANIADVEAFWEIADYLVERGCITEGGPDYWTLAVTPKGVLRAAR